MEEVDEGARQYMSGSLRDRLIKEIAAVEESSSQTGHFSLSFGHDPYRRQEALDILVLGYKCVFDTSGGYVEAAVRIEDGARPDPLPTETRTIVAYVASKMGADDFSVPNVTTVKPERTFWKKVLSHAMTEATEKRSVEEDPEKGIPDLNRYSRHYYDVHQIWTHADYGLATASMRELAEACRQHKALMFRSPDHRYDRAVPGTYRLMPTTAMRKKLATDYEKMPAMIYATPLSFDAIVTSIEELQKQSTRPIRILSVPSVARQHIAL